MATKILMSFAMANHGARFAHWLRNELMKHYKLAGVDDVYMDCAVARMRDSQKLENTLSMTSEKNVDGWPVLNDGRPVPGNALGEKREVGVTYVMPDMRGAQFSANKPHLPGHQKDSINIGAGWVNWNENFKAAMTQAAVVVFCYTPEFAASEWCRKEWAQYMEETTRRPSLRGVGLDFGGGSQFFNNQPRGFKRLALNKQVHAGGGKNIFAWEAGDYTLSSSDFAKLTGAIGRL